MKPTKLLAFLLCATVPLACTTTEPVKPETASASYPLTIYPGEEGVFAPSGKSRGKSALAPGRHVARGPFPVNLRDVPPGLTRDKAPPGMEVSKEKRIESPVSEEERERMLEDSKRLPPNARAARGLMSGPSNDGPSTLGPTVGTGWASIDYINSVPPDPEIAVGPNHVIVTVNSAFQIYDKSGNTVVAETDFDNFFSGVCTGTFDPNALYDEDQDRYIIAMDGNGTEYCVAVSQTNDPTQGWYRYSVPTGSDFFDYPHAGVGRDAIYMGANIFGNSYLRAEIYAIDKFAMYAGTSAPYVMQNIGGVYFTPQPMNLHGAAQGTWPSFGPHYIISGQYNGTTFHVWSWDDPFGANNLVRLGSFDLNSATGVSGGNAVDQPQLGSTAQIQGNDWRPLDTEYRDGYLWMSHTIACNPGSGTVNCVRWAQIDPTTQTVLDAGVVASNDEYRSFPDLAVDACGNMAVGYTKTSSSMYPGVYVAGREAADPPGTLQAESLVKAGEISYTAFDGSPHRWGDYTVMTIDPDGSTFWYVGEYSKNTGTTNGRWATWVNASTFGCIPPNAPPAVSVDPATIATMIIGGDEDEFIDNCEVTMVDFEVRNSGAGELTNVEIVSVTPVSPPNSVISTPMPVMLAATLAENASVAASFEFSATDAAPGDTLTFDVEIYADELTENKVVSMSFDDAEYDIQPVASRTWNFASDIEDWTVQQGTFNHNSGAGAGGSSGYVASSANLDNQCDQIRSPVVYLESDSTLSLSTNYDIEPVYQGQDWYDQANVALLDGGSRGIVDPDSGRLYNADGFGASCVTAGGNGWAASATSWAASGWSANALGSAALAGKPVQIDVAYGTDNVIVGSGFRFDQVTLTNFSQQGPDAQSNVCDGNTAPSVTIASPADGASFQEGDAIGFSASASDTEDGDLTASIAWSSDKDGSIGSGASLNLSTLSANAHVITAAVTDSGSLSGSDSISITVNAPPAVSIDSFAASPNPIVVGESSTLSWSVSNATECQAGGDWSGTQNAGGGSEGVSPATAGDYTYTLSCTGDGAPASASVTLTVTPPPATIHVGDLDGSSVPGSRNRWTAVVDILVNDNGGQPVSGVVVSAAWTNGTNGSPSCTTGSNGRCTVSKANLKGNLSSVDLTVTGLSNGVNAYAPGDNQDPDGDSDGTVITVFKDGPPPNLLPTASDDAFLTEIDTPVSGNVLANDDLGDTPSSVVGNTQGANGSVSMAGNGDFTYTPNSEFEGNDSFVYTLEDANGDQDSATVQITVAASPPPAVDITSFTVTPGTIADGESADLEWSVSNANACTASGDWSGAKNATSGSESVSPSAGSYTYTLACSGDGAGDSASVTLTVTGVTSTMYVANVTGAAASAPRNRWVATATITVESGGSALAGVLVEGGWSNGVNGSGSCTTNGAGSCEISRSNIKGNTSSVTFTVSNLSLSGYTYDSSLNGTDTVIISKP